MFVISHSKSLKFGLFTEQVFPRRERRPASIKNEVVSLLPDMPSNHDEGLHEEGILVLLF
jgi:hypothetical protein